MNRPVVLLATEGTYPYHPGGVSTWCDALVQKMGSVDFVLFAVAMNPYVVNRFTMTPNVREVIMIPLWGMQDPSEHRQDLAFSEIFTKKQRTLLPSVEQTFIPAFQEFLNQLLTRAQDPEVLGQALASMHRYFQGYDYQVTLKTEVVWTTFRTWLLQGAQQGYWEEPTVFECVQALGWLYHFLIVLNTSLPRVDLVHSSAAAFCGMSGIVSKILYGTPYLLTEHGVYLREQYLSIGRSNMSRFSKKFLLLLVTAIVRTNLHYADEVAPVCQFNGRWERLFGADGRKIRVIYNGVSPETFKPAPIEPAPSVRVLVVARADPNKDWETLLRAVAIAHKKVGNIKVTVRGSVSVPDYYERMVQLRKELGLDEVVDFPGHAENVAEEYAKSDLVVQSSVSEAFPYSVIEAMMSGRPMVATDVGGTSEALANTGLLVPARDPARLALGLMMLAQDAALRRQLGDLAHQRALQHFNIDRSVNLFERVYRSLARAGGVSDERRRQTVVMERAYALLAIGWADAALDQLQDALGLAVNTPAAVPILAEMARVERILGRHQDSARHLVKAWLLDRYGAPQAS